jgi:hypothetical protein
MHEEFDQDGNVIIPTHIKNFLRRKLVCKRYNHTGACANSRRFVDNKRREITIQEVDVAALCHTRFQAEAYECKVRSNKLDRDDCNDLKALTEYSQEINYQINVGIISFDNDQLLNRHLLMLEASPHSKANDTRCIAALE